jgi:hypothetical protein
MSMKRKKTAATPKSSPQVSRSSTDLQDFQKAYGAQLLAITQSTPFREAMYLLNKAKLNGITGLSNEAIERNGREILADLRGHLKHEDDLMSLPTRTEEFPIEEAEDYFSPTQVAEFELIKEKFREQNEKSRYG